jgi:hypothetical protein
MRMERKYVTRRNGAAGGSNAGGGSSGRSWILPLCVYTFVCAEIETEREAVAFRMLENVQTMLVGKDRGEGVTESGHRSEFFELTILDFLSCLLPIYENMTGPMSYLLT